MCVEEMPSASGERAPAEPWAVWGSRAASAPHPALCTRALLPPRRRRLGYHHRHHHQPAAGNGLPAALLGPGKLPSPPLGCPGRRGGGWAQPHPSLWLCLLPQPGWPDLALPPAPGLFGAATLSPDSAAEKPQRDLSRSQSQAPETKCAR